MPYVWAEQASPSVLRYVRDEGTPARCCSIPTIRARRHSIEGSLNQTECTSCEAGFDAVMVDLSFQTGRCDVEQISAADAPLLARPYYATGDPGPIVAALAHVPELLEAALPFIGMALSPSSIPIRTKELVIVRTSAGAGCRFCVDAHSAVALDSGLSVIEVRALRGEGTIASTFPDPAERALLDWVDIVTLPGPVRPADRRAAMAEYPDHQLVELTMVAAATLMLNRFCTALNLPTDPSVAQRLSDAGIH